MAGSKSRIGASTDAATDGVARVEIVTRGEVRREYTSEERAQVLTEAAMPGARVVLGAERYGISPSLVQRRGRAGGGRGRRGGRGGGAGTGADGGVDAGGACAVGGAALRHLTEPGVSLAPRGGGSSGAAGAGAGSGPAAACWGVG